MSTPNTGAEALGIVLVASRPSRVGGKASAGHGVPLPDHVRGGSLENQQLTGVPGAGTEIDDVIGDGDQLRFVLHRQHCVSLVARLQRQLTHALHVVGCNPVEGSSKT